MIFDDSMISATPSLRVKLASSNSANPQIQRLAQTNSKKLLSLWCCCVRSAYVPTMRGTLAKRKWALPTLATFIALLQVCDSFVLPGAAASLRQHHDPPIAAAATRESGWHSTAHSRSAPASTPASRSAVPCRASVAAVKRSRVQMAAAKGAAAAAAEIDEDERVQAESLRAKNDQEWQFFDTSRVNVKAGMGGNG